jgi:hypothetical protein
MSNYQFVPVRKNMRPKARVAPGLVTSMLIDSPSWIW